MILKRHLLWAMMLAASVPTFAADDDGVQIVLSFNNGWSATSFSFDENPVITFTDDSVNIKTSASKKPYSVLFEEVKTFTFGEQTGLECDVNGDGKVDFADVEHIVDGKSNAAETIRADLNHDGVVDVADIFHVINNIKQPEK